MLPKSILDAAKAYLCWDAFADLAIQLIPIGTATGYYYPPGNRLHGILLFYDPRIEDFSEPLFLLFHEAGHACQWRRMREAGREDRFSQHLACPAGPAKASFEQEAWDLGQEVFLRYLQTAGLDGRLSAAYQEYGRRCCESYREGP